MKKNKGFTLVELMIVVAIIGILASIAIPDFLKLQAKSRQAEAKMNLGAIYSSQIAYFAEESEFAGGNNAFTKLGWEPRSTHVARYVYIMDGDQHMPLNNPPTDIPPGISPTANTFTALAAGNIDKDPASDIWTIDDAKQLANTQPDI